MATKKPNLPKFVFVFRNEEGYLIVDDSFDDLPDGAIVGTYKLGSVERMRVTRELVRR